MDLRGAMTEYDAMQLETRVSRLQNRFSGNNPLYNGHKIYARNTPSPDETSQPVGPTQRPPGFCSTPQISALRRIFFFVLSSENLALV